MPGPASRGPLLRRRSTLVLATVVLLAIGGAARIAGSVPAADGAWRLAIVVALIPLCLAVLRGIIHHQPGVDIVALLAMVGALALGEYLAGAVVAVMYASGGALEEFASARAARELRLLAGRAPTTAHRRDGGEVRDIPVARVEVGDLLLVRSGEVVPVDGVAVGPAVLDESALTGEARPMERAPGDRVGSGTVNAGAPFELRAIATAEASTYAGIVRLVGEAQAAKAPLSRLADRWALVFVPFTLAVSAAAWAISGDSVRALAVLVVATPCPLILAVPVALVSGISRGARRGIVVKGGAALEALGRARVLLFDKTGTLTAGDARLTDVEVAEGHRPDEVLRLAASLDQVSHHVLGAALVRAARARGLSLSFPTQVTEAPGQGIRGTVDGRRVAVGRADWVMPDAASPWLRRVRRRLDREGLASVFVAVDGAPAGALLLEDRLRPDSPRTLRLLRREGITRIVMVTGDHIDVAETIGAAVGVDEVLADRTPEEKLAAVRQARAQGPMVMVGDGINDAPALAAADVGVAMGARGATASSEAADVVLTADRLDRLVDAVRIARRSRHIALQSAALGMGMSVAAMLVAAAGYLPPVAGAVLQEAIDVVVIANALRALGGGRGRRQSVGVAEAELGRRLSAEHLRLAGGIERLRTVADSLGHINPRVALRELVEVRKFLVDTVVPHERDEAATLYPVVSAVIGGEDPTGVMLRAHVEIEHLVRHFARAVDDLPPSGPAVDDLAELRRLLYGLHAVLRLHTAQEDEAYVSLVDSEPTCPAQAPAPSAAAVAENVVARDLGGPVGAHSQHGAQR
jgi:heavy metal translocating P-type ATPase